ncbi:MAG: hypothetical protein HQL64_09430 [Magnetococcales bacterium]|nr:hypothetical protein [Magnetococcales bacterium]
MNGTPPTLPGDCAPEFLEAVREYVDRFGQGPPTWGVDEERALKAIHEALRSGIPLAGLHPEEIPDDAEI